jgi:sulfatase modifying factor 1
VNRSRRAIASALVASLASLSWSCDRAEPAARTERDAHDDSDAHEAHDESDAHDDSPASPMEGADAGEPPCPAGMIFVAGTYCNDVERTCEAEEKNDATHITLCHAFAHETRCVSKDARDAGEQTRAFCIDTYEYPNEAGAHPSWMVTWYDAEATCRSNHKRLCYESEWTMACEGPSKSPFPYGWERDGTACNVDNVFIAPSLEKMNAIDPPDAGDAAVQALELVRLDQSVPSGAMDRCVSGFGVRDMTGNFDEWTTNDRPVGPRGPDTGRFASLKGGAWGHVRNACRPVTTKHSPGWAYYFVSFRCCADAKGYPSYVPPLSASPRPKIVAADKAPRVSAAKGAPGPSRIKVNAKSH